MEESQCWLFCNGFSDLYQLLLKTHLVVSMLTVLQWFFWSENYNRLTVVRMSQCWLFCNGFSDKKKLSKQLQKQSQCWLFCNGFSDNFWIRGFSARHCLNADCSAMVFLIPITPTEFRVHYRLNADCSAMVFLIK